MKRLVAEQFQWLAFFVLGLAAAVSYWHFSKCSRSCDIAAENYRNCQQLASQITQLRMAPQRAQLATRSTDDLGSVVEQAAGKAQLQRDRILRIDPQPGKRLGKTDYLEQGTEVELANVTLRQAVDFIYGVTNRDEQLSVNTLRLQTPHSLTDSGGAELWLADIILTQRIYAPTTPR